MPLADLLGLGELPKELISSFLPVKDLFRVSRASVACCSLCRVSLRSLRLQAFGANAAEALLRLVKLRLTDQGAGILQIDASFCRSVTNATLQQLPVLPALERLNLDGCQDVDDEGLAAVAQRCRGLRSFSIYWNVKVTDLGLGKVLRAQPCGRLQELCFSGCKLLTDETLQRLVGRAMSLKVLDLTRCNKVTDLGVALVCENLSELRVLRLYAMAQLEPKAFEDLARLTQLEELDLCGCRCEDEAVVAFLAAGAAGALQTLNLTWCPSLTDDSMLAVAKHCSRLNWLSFFGNLNITAAAVEALAASASGASLQFLDLRGLSKAAPYANDGLSVRQIFPRLVSTELHH